MEEISAKQMAIYRATAQRRRQKEEQELALRRRRAWEVARQAAQILKEQFGAERVLLFGSLPFPERFHAHSDIDLAAWGVDEKRYYRAVACLLDLDPAISVDLVEAEFASPALLERIAQEGIAL
jgi:predicted nucleotidyltransferase